MTNSATAERSITVVAVLVAAVGIVFNDWLPTGLLDEVGASGNNDRRDLLRFCSVLLPLAALALWVCRRAVARNLTGIVVMCLSTALSITGLVAVDVYLSQRAVLADCCEHEITDVHTPDELLGWRPRPNSVGTHREAGSFEVRYVIDTQGYKRIENQGEATARIFFFGDSYTFGHGVDNADTYANILASEYLLDNIHVFNLGVMGYGIEQMYGRFLEIADDLRPGDIVVFAPTSQDIKRNLKDFVFPSKLIFGRRLEFGNTYPYYINGKLQARPLVTPGNEVLAKLFNGRWTKNVFRFLHSAIMSPATTGEAGEIFQHVRAMTEDRGAEFALYFLPQTKECLRSLFEEDVSSFEYSNLMNEFPSGEAELAALRFKTDSHWNRTGHELVARVLLKSLIEHEKLAPEQLTQVGRAIVMP